MVNWDTPLIAERIGINPYGFFVVFHVFFYNFLEHVCIFEVRLDMRGSVNILICYI